MQTNKTKVVIIGGGVIGSSIAYYLCKDHDISPVIIEQSHIACSSSGKAGGFLARDWCDGSPSQELTHFSFALHEELNEVIDVDYQYRKIETRSVSCLCSESVKEFDKSDAPDWIDRSVIREVERIGSVENTAQVTPGLFTNALCDSAVSMGAQVIIGKAVNLVIQNGVVQGVVLENGEIVSADKVVIAMGPWSGRFTDSILTQFPKVSSTFMVHSIVIKEPESNVLGEAVFGDIVFNGDFKSQEIYPRPNGEVYTCGNGKYADLPDRAEDTLFDESDCTQLKEILDQISPTLRKYEIDKMQACFIPYTTDSVPLIGAIEEIDGLYIGSGHNVWGILNSTGTGKLLSELIITGKTSISLEPFNPNRKSLQKKKK